MADNDNYALVYECQCSIREIIRDKIAVQMNFVSCFPVIKNVHNVGTQGILPMEKTLLQSVHKCRRYLAQVPLGIIFLC